MHMSFPTIPISLPRQGITNEIALQGAIWSFRIAVANWLSALEEAEPAEVVMLHSERGAMELADVVASNAHDAFHHRWDMARILHTS
jgi:hypothetical protein